MKKIFLGFLFLVLLGGSLESVFGADIASCTSKKEKQERIDCFDEVIEAQKQKLKEEEDKFKPEMPFSAAADAFDKLQVQIDDLVVQRDKLPLTAAKQREAFDKQITVIESKQPVCPNPSGCFDYTKNGTKSGDKAGLLAEYEQHVKAKGDLKAELTAMDAYVEGYAIRNAIERMSKETSYFSVTGKKRDFVEAADGTFSYTEMMDPNRGLRATENSQEAEMTFGGDDSDTNLLTRVISLAIRFMGTMVVLFFVIAGFFMITSRGDENQLQKGKTIFTYTIIGAFVAFTSYIVVQFIVNILFISS